MPRLITQIASIPDQDGLVCEIWCDDAQVAEVSHGQDGQAQIEIYPPIAGGPWMFILTDLQAVLAQAEDKLSSFG